MNSLKRKIILFIVIAGMGLGYLSSIQLGAAPAFVLLTQVHASEHQINKWNP